ncbi:MAG: lipoprotein [Lachnospiraceae bacterium]|jgi:predicted small lipoprotein YifL
MKKFFAILLAAIMVISLAACGEQKEPEKTKAPETAEETTEAAEEIETPSETETEAPSDAPEETEEQKVGGTLKAGNPEVSPLATYTIEGDTVIIDGEIKWYDENLDMEIEAGNYAAVIVTAPEIYDEAYLVANVTARLDDGDLMGWVEGVYAELYLRFDANTRSHTITFNWSEENTQVLTVKLADTAILQPAQ